MKFLSLIVLSGLLTVSCAHKKCGSNDHCDKDSKSCCQKEKSDCKDGHCKKDEAKKEEVKTDAKKQ
ncbi:MAG: hypothetical protein V4598_07580 [Bdellovibrionota bacterium]